jgi:carboxymethylenebutenolidase
MHGTVPTLVYRPAASGPHPAIALGAEATGVNSFLRQVAATLAARGFVTALPDYYRGGGPRDPEAYDDLDDILAHLAELDFVRATRDLMVATDFLAARPEVDPGRLGLWGYCTGATLALLAACARNDLAATVLFYPSQPYFETLDERHPVSPWDLLWTATGPLLFLYGTEDIVLPARVEDDLRRRIDEWQLDAELTMFPGAGHAFCAPGASYHEPGAADGGWQAAVRFIERHLRDQDA